LAAEDHAPDATFDEAPSHFSARELGDLTVMIATIDTRNRVSIAARLEPGSCQPGRAHEGKAGG
jgi:alkylhydroperoxidase family enzyme